VSLPVRIESSYIAPVARSAIRVGKRMRYDMILSNGYGEDVTPEVVR
jgi:hypothetical protein